MRKKSRQGYNEGYKGFKVRAVASRAVAVTAIVGEVNALSLRCAVISFKFIRQNAARLRRRLAPPFRRMAIFG
jgi:hypothetical protein